MFSPSPDRRPGCGGLYSPARKLSRVGGLVRINRSETFLRRSKIGPFLKNAVVDRAGSGIVAFLHSDGRFCHQRRRVSPAAPPKPSFTSFSALQRESRRPNPEQPSPGKALPLPLSGAAGGPFATRRIAFLRLVRFTSAVGCPGKIARHCQIIGQAAAAFLQEAVRPRKISSLIRNMTRSRSDVRVRRRQFARPLGICQRLGIIFKRPCIQLRQRQRRFQ